MPAVTLDQKRARHAWAVTRQVIGNPDEAFRKKYGTQVKKLPPRILAAGLGQALAFLLAKGHEELLRDLGHWVMKRESYPASATERPSMDALLRQIIESDAGYLRRATEEALAYLLWLGRFAEAEHLTDEAGGEP